MRQVGTQELVGRTLGEGEYRLVAHLGAGGMGAVYEAEQTRLRRRVAVKVLWPHLTQEPGLVVRFNREARIAARLEHPHILPVYDFGEESGLLYLVMRLVRGGSLKDRLRGEGPRRPGWSPREALELARQALPPLDYAHRQGIVHRDLKPDNILLEPSDEFTPGYRLFLGDFGIATLAQGDEIDVGLTQTGGALGTPAYMAPEQVLDQRVDGRADLYAFGVVLFEVLAGQVPYRGHTPLGVAMQHIREPVPLARELNPRLPGAVEAVLSRALAKDREDRFANGAALIDALAQAVERSETAVPAAPPRRSRPEPPPPPPASGRTPQPPENSAAADPPDLARRGAFPRGRRGLLLVALGLLLGLLAVGGGLIASSLLTAPQPETTLPSAADAGRPASSSPALPQDPRAWVVAPSDLGPGWSLTHESTAGSTAQLGVYEVEYTDASASPDSAGTTGFSLFSAASVADAEAGQQQLRQSAEAGGHVFTSVPDFTPGNPALRGRAVLPGDSPRLSIVYLFRVNSVVAIAEVIGAADHESIVGNAAQHAAELQRDRLL